MHSLRSQRTLKIETIDLICSVLRIYERRENMHPFKRPQRTLKDGNNRFNLFGIYERRENMHSLRWHWLKNGVWPRSYTVSVSNNLKKMLIKIKTG